MSAVAILAADGFETIECLTIVDVLRRGGVRATLVSIMPTRDVISAQQISVSCDCTFDELDFPEGTYAGGKSVVVDGNIITASAMGQALPFALAVLEDIAGEVAVSKVREGIQL